MCTERLFRFSNMAQSCLAAGRWSPWHLVPLLMARAERLGGCHLVQRCHLRWEQLVRGPAVDILVAPGAL